jgi:hypothetical protein
MLDYFAFFKKWKVMFTPGSSVAYPHRVDLYPDPVPYRPKPSTARGQICIYNICVFISGLEAELFHPLFQRAT